MTYKHSSIQQRVYQKKKKYLTGQWGWGLVVIGIIEFSDFKMALTFVCLFFIFIFLVTKEMN